MSMFTRFIVAAITVAAIFFHSPAATAQKPSREPTAAQQAKLKEWLKRFPKADANGDGELTLDEARKYREEVLSKRKRPANSRQVNSVKPTHADVAYGPHQRNVFDLWLPERKPGATEKTPIFVYFHGGGFVGGDKSGFNPTPFLNAGMAVVSGNYRFVDGRETLSPAPLHDSARVIQFLRSRADEWNLDSDRICVCGSSAGAVISMWIGYHDDLAQADSDDSVARQSSRVRCIVPINGPANLDPRWITKNMGGPKHIHGSFPKLFGAQVSDDRPEVRELILESSPFEHVSKDDPPSLLIYTGDPGGVPLPETATSGALVHHAFFGQELKKRLDEVGVANEFRPGVDPRANEFEIIRNWLKKQL